jgi:geranylgeranyl reductase
MCDDKDVQRLTFDSYLYKRVVMMNPWQQIKLTLLTFASILRGQALAPQSYQPVASAVRSPEEMAERQLAAANAHGHAVIVPSQSTTQAVDAPPPSLEEREPALAGKG